MGSMKPMKHISTLPLLSWVLKFKYTLRGKTSFDKFSDPDWTITGQEGPTWWVIHHDILEAVIQTWTGTAWTGTRTCNFSTSFRFGFCSEVGELHGWSTNGHAKICERVMTANPHWEHIGPSSRVHSCLNLFFPVRNGMENFALKISLCGVVLYMTTLFPLSKFHFKLATF